MINEELSVIKANSLNDAYREVMWLCVRKGYDFVVKGGSYVGQIRKQLESVKVEIEQPWIRPLAPSLPAHAPVSTSDERIEKYFVEKVIGTVKGENEDYTYGEYISHQTPKIIQLLRDSKGNTNQACINIGGNEMVEKDDPACLRTLTFKVVEGKLNMSVFMRCLHGDVPVLIKRSDVVYRTTIENLYDLAQKGEEIYVVSVDEQHKPIWGRVAFAERSIKNNLMVLDVVGAGKLKVTRDHRMCVIDDKGSVSLVEAGKLTIQNRLAEIAGLAELVTIPNDSVDLLKLFRYRQDVFVCGLDLEDFKQLRKNGVAFKGCHRDRRVIPVDVVYESYLGGVGDLSLKCKKITLPRIFNLSEDMLYFMGRWIADGWYNNKGNALRLAINNKDDYGFARIMNFFRKELNYVPSIEQRRGCVCLNISIGMLVYMFQDLGFIHGAKIKVVPSFVFNLSASKMESFVQGWLSGDAGVSASRKLVVDFAYILKRLNKYFSIYSEKGREVLFKFENRLIKSGESHRISFWGANRDKSKVRTSNGLIHRKIKSVSFATESGYVYDIGVDTSCHLFACGDTGLLVHNSWDLYSGLPENLGGFQMYKEYVLAHFDDTDFGWQDGKIIAYSDGLHLYEQYFKISDTLNVDKIEVSDGVWKDKHEFIQNL